jgi:hypothetical protein
MDTVVSDPKFEKIRASAIKESVKLGMDLTGASEMGGTEFFVTTLHNVDGNFELLMDAKKALMEECTTVGVILLSASKAQLVACCIVPEALSTVIPADEWLAHAFKAVGATVSDGATATYAEGIITPKEGQFAIKLKDAVQQGGVEVLRQKGKIIDSDSEDDMVFGDDDLGNY